MHPPKSDRRGSKADRGEVPPAEDYPVRVVCVRETAAGERRRPACGHGNPVEREPSIPGNPPPFGSDVRVGSDRLHAQTPEGTRRNGRLVPTRYFGRGKSCLQIPQRLSGFRRQKAILQPQVAK